MDLARLNNEPLSIPWFKPIQVIIGCAFVEPTCLFLEQTFFPLEINNCSLSYSVMDYNVLKMGMCVCSKVQSKRIVEVATPTQSSFSLRLCPGYEQFVQEGLNEEGRIHFTFYSSHFS